MGPPSLPQLEVPGFQLRGLVPDDAAAWHRIIADPRVHGPTSWPLFSAEALTARVTALVDRADAWRWAIVSEDGTLVGTCGATRWTLGEAEVAYELRPDVWGRGLATAAVRAFLEAALQARIGRVVAHVRVDNERSARVLRRAGFVAEALLPAFRDCRGEVWDFWRWVSGAPLRLTA